jgi:hypothetical protein
LLEWIAEFANNIDESMWFLLLFMFELERQLAVVDLAEAAIWLLILLAIEMNISEWRGELLEKREDSEPA